MSSGIQDYLLKPLNPDTLREAFLGAQAALVAPRAHDADADRPRMATAVIGVRGGVGGSTVASSLAWLLAEKEHRSTALLDLDVHFCTGAIDRKSGVLGTRVSGKCYTRWFSVPYINIT